MTDFEKALAQAKKFAEKNENQITETEFEAITDSYLPREDGLSEDPRGHGRPAGGRRPGGLGAGARGAGGKENHGGGL